MRSRSVWIVILALVIGFILGQAIKCCRKPPATSVMLPQTIKPGTVLKWDAPDPNIGKLTLTIPYGLCDPTPAGTYSSTYKVYVIDVPSGGVTCTVKTQAGTTTIPYYYKYFFEQATTRGGATPSSAIPQVEMLDVVGSCGGCDARHEMFATAASKEQYANVECINDKPHVVDNNSDDLKDIQVVSTTKSVYWQLQGPGSLTFTFDNTQPYMACSNSTNYILTGPECQVNDQARNNTPYRYTVSVDTCGSGTLSDTYTLTLQQSPAPKQ